MAKQIYRIDENDLRRIIKEAINEIIPLGNFVAASQNAQNIKKDWEKGNGVAGISFGIKKRRMNKEKTLKYATELESLAQKVELISSEIERRIGIIQSVTSRQVNEGGGGTAVKAALNIGRKVAKPTTRAAKVVPKVIGGATVGSFVAGSLGVPQTVAEKIRAFKNPNGITVPEVVDAFSSLAGWMQQVCIRAKNNPEILGAYAISQELTNGPKDQQGQPLFTAEEGLWLAASIGAAYLGPVGWIYDVLDIAGGLVSAKANDDEELLRIVESQKQYVVSAINKMNNVLAQSKTNSINSANRQITGKVNNTRSR